MSCGDCWTTILAWKLAKLRVQITTVPFSLARGLVLRKIFMFDCLGQNFSSFKNEPFHLRKHIEGFVFKASFGKLFDLIEFLLRHDGCSDKLKSACSNAFVATRAAYRIIDAQIVAIGTEQQAASFEAAIVATEAKGEAAARTHLIAAAAEIKHGHWASSIRESIHAVEAIALRLTTDATTLGPALSKLENDGYLHGGRKAALSALYGYSSDEEGVRHALVFQQEAQVDEADALFMLGACSSFVSFLIVRGG